MIFIQFIFFIKNKQQQSIKKTKYQTKQGLIKQLF